MTQNNGRIDRERDHYDHAIPTADQVVEEYLRGPDPNTRRMLDAVEPEKGGHILDFACGSGVTSMWLAARGARVTGVDLSPKSIDVATEVAARLGLAVRFLVADLQKNEQAANTYDGVVGRYALHHLDVSALAPSLAGAVKCGGVGAFVETMALNPVLRVARKHLTGRFGISRYGTLDEHPLVPADLEAMCAAFGNLDVVTEHFMFFTIFDRQLFHYRSPLLSKVCDMLDARLLRTRVGRTWSYHQVLIARKTVTPTPPA